MPIRTDKIPKQNPAFSDLIFEDAPPYLTIETGNNNAAVTVPFGPEPGSKQSSILEVEGPNESYISSIYPLSTKEFELTNFFNSYAKYYNTEEDKKELRKLIYGDNPYGGPDNKKGILEDLSNTNGNILWENIYKNLTLQNDPKNQPLRLKLDARRTLAHLSPIMYMRFRKYQIEQIKDTSKEINDFLERLELIRDETAKSIVLHDSAAYGEIKESLQNLHTELDAKKVVKKTLSVELEELKQKLLSQEEQLKQQAEQQVAEFTKTVEQQKKEIAKKEAELKAIEDEIATIQQDRHNILSKDKNYVARVKYYQDMHNLYKNIDLKEETTDDSNITKFSIYTTDEPVKPLSTIFINQNQNTLSCEIPGDLSLNDQEKAVLVSLDLLSRNKERSYDLNLTITGFKNNPKMALRLYNGAAQQGFIPQIENATLAAWKENLATAQQELLGLGKEMEINPTKKAMLEKNIHKYDTALNYYYQLNEGKIKNYEEAYIAYLKNAAWPNPYQNNFENAKKDMIQEFQNNTQPETAKQELTPTTKDANPTNNTQTPSTSPSSNSGQNTNRRSSIISPN